ncbi:MAG: hypothetical protein AB8F26_08875 [Phycisphaerales bacterium]
MSQIAANHPAPDQTALSDRDWQHRLDAIAADPRMTDDNIRANGVAGKLGMPLLLIGAIGLLVTIIGAFSFNLRHALAAFEVGVFTALAMSLGSIFFLLVFHSLNAGWVITCRRVFENIASIVWFPWVLMVIVLVIEWSQGGVLLEWMGGTNGNYLLEKKAAYLNPGFFAIRVLIYGAVWIFLGRRFASLSRQGDETGDRALGRKARFTAGWGILLFALTTAFAAFDFLMSIDYRFFSTMWGVYFFASCALSAVSAVVLVLAILRSRNKLEGLVTNEHFHDLGKLMFAFTVFWAYVAFSQYFLIWYSNIPEETMWYTYRKSSGWMWLFTFLCVGHFIVPFLVIIWRGVKRSAFLLGVMALFMVAVTIADMVWIIRPMVYTPEVIASGVSDPGIAGIWLDAVGVLGVLGVWGFLLTRAIEAGNLLPTKDAMLHESMKHKNYV